MIIKRALLLAAAFWAASFSFCFSESGITNNAAAAGNTWDMGVVLPPQTGLTVNGLVYQYSTEKNVEDNLQVIIENDNAVGDGLVFQNVDDWSGVPGATISRSIPLNNIPKELWGDGRIRTFGDGVVTDPNVQYTYQFDPCAVVLSNPECPGYSDALLDYLKGLGLLDANAESDDPLLKEYLDGLMETEIEEETVSEEEAEEEKEEKDMEDALRASSAAEKIADSVTQTAMLEALTSVEKINSYYAAEIKGGEYKEQTTLNDAVIDDNRGAALRMGLANDRLHNELIDLQY